jgi:hypothetical protein
VLIVGGKLVKGFGAISSAFKAMSALVAANPWVLLIAATIALVTLIVANWDKIKAAVAAVWQWIKDAAGTVWDVVSGVFQHIVDFLVGLFENWTLPGLIIKHWDTIKDAATAVKDWVVDKFQAVLDFFKALPGKLGDFFVGLAETITAPFRAAFNAIANLWNDTVGSLSFKVPSWVPLIGGKGWDVPDIPTFHQGGVFRAPTPGGEGLALLRDGERVSPAGMSGMNVTINLDARGNPNGEDIAKKVVRQLDRRLRIYQAEAQRAIG